MEEIAQLPDGTLREVHEQAAAYRRWQDSPAYLRARQVADAWCAAFMWLNGRGRRRHDDPPAIVNRVFQALRERGSTAIPPATATEIERLREEYGFFHWHLEFPGIFQVRDDDQHADPATGWSGGFSCVLANPPWDKVDFEDKKYFSVVEPSIALMTGQNRRDRIVEWEMEHEDEGKRYRAARRKVKGTFGFASSSDVYPWCAKGLTAPGLTRCSRPAVRRAVRRGHRAHWPDGLHHPDRDRVRRGRPVPVRRVHQTRCRRLAVRLRESADSSSLLWIRDKSSACSPWQVGRCRSPSARYAFFLLDTAELDDAGRIFALSPDELALINPNTGTLPIFRNRRDAGLTLRSTSASRSCGTRRSQTATRGASPSRTCST